MANTPAMKVLDCLSQTPVSSINKNSLNPQAPPFLPDKDHFFFIHSRTKTHQYPLLRGEEVVPSLT